MVGADLDGFKVETGMTIMLRVIYGLVLALSIPFTAQSASVQYGQSAFAPTVSAITAVTDIVVGGATYRVDFFFGSAASAYGFDFSDGSFAVEPFSLGKEALTRSILAEANTALNAQSVRQYLGVTATGATVNFGGTDLITAVTNNYRAIVGRFQANSPPDFGTRAVQGGLLSGDFTLAPPVFNLTSSAPTVFANITAVPVPASLILMIGGLLGLAASSGRIWLRSGRATANG